MQAALPHPDHLVGMCSCPVGLAPLLENDSAHLWSSEVCETHCARPYQQTG